MLKRMLIFVFILLTNFLAFQVGQVKAGTTFNLGENSSRVQQQWFRDCTGSACNPDEINRAVDSIWTRIFVAAYALIAGLAVLLLINAGIQYISAGNSPEKVKKARQRIINIVMGIALLAASYAVIDLIWGLAGNIAGNL